MSIKIHDIDTSKYVNKNIRKNHKDLPANPFRMLISASSGAGEFCLEKYSAVHT